MSNDIPAGWSERPFSELAEYVNGCAFKPTDWGTAGLPIVRIAQITNPDAEPNFYDGEVNSRHLIDTGDLIFSWSATLAVMRWTRGPAILNQHLFKVMPAKGIDSFWLQYRLQASMPDLAEEAHGTTMKHIRKGTLSSKKTSVPPLHEQQLIAKVLVSVDDAIGAAERVERQLESLWNALVEKLIWTQIKERPSCVQLLGAALTKSDYGVNVPLTLDEVGVPILRMGNIQSGRIDFEGMKWGVVSEQEAVALALSEGDILFNRTNSRDLVGKVALVREDTDCLYASYIVRLAVNRKIVEPYYLFAIMHSQRGQSLFKAIATPGVSQSNINPTNLKKQKIPLPDLATQKAIAEKLRSVEQARLSAASEIKSLQSIKQNLLTELLSGRKRVPTTGFAAAVQGTGRPVPSAFKRAVLAAEVVHQLHKDAKFGSVKHEKVVHLCEYHADLHHEIDRHAYKKAAGPYDPKARRSVESNFKSHKWFDVKKGQAGRTEYIPMEKCGEHKQYFDRYFASQRGTIQTIIDLLRPLDSQRCEIIATLYAVWNDYLIDGTKPTDGQIVDGARNNWHVSKQAIPEDRWVKALEWMRQKSLVPCGTGEKTRIATA